MHLVSPSVRLPPRLDAWSFSPEEINEAIGGRRLLNPSIDLSSMCNLSCIYCFARDHGSLRVRRSLNELSLEESLSIIDDFAGAGARTINLVGAGEPTLDPNFFTIIERINSHRLRTLLFTNGIRIAHQYELANWLLDRNVSVAIKLNSMIPEIQDKLVNKIGYSAIRNHALQSLMANGFAKAQRTHLAVDIIAMRIIKDELPSIYEWCRANYIFPIVADFIPTRRTGSESERWPGQTVLARVYRVSGVFDRARGF